MALGRRWPRLRRGTPGEMPKVSRGAIWTMHPWHEHGPSRNLLARRIKSTFGSLITLGIVYPFVLQVLEYTSVCLYKKDGRREMVLCHVLLSRIRESRRFQVKLDVVSLSSASVRRRPVVLRSSVRRRRRRQVRKHPNSVVEVSSP